MIDINSEKLYFRDALSELDSHEISEKEFITALKNNSLRSVVEIKSATGKKDILIPSSFWADKESSFLYSSRSMRSKSAAFGFTLSRLLPSLWTELTRILRAESAGEVRSSATGTAFEFWFSDIHEGPIEQFSDWRDSVIAVLFDRAPVKVRPFVRRGDLNSFINEYLGSQGRRPGRPKKTSSDDFWIQAFKTLRIISIDTNQGVFVQEMMKKAEAGLLGNDLVTDSMIRKNAGRIWQECELTGKKRKSNSNPEQ